MMRGSCQLQRRVGERASGLGESQASPERVPSMHVVGLTGHPPAVLGDTQSPESLVRSDSSRPL